MARTTRSTKTGTTPEAPAKKAAPVKKAVAKKEPVKATVEAPAEAPVVDERDVSELRRVAHAIAEEDKQARFDLFSPIVGSYTGHARAAAAALGHKELSE